MHIWILQTGEPVHSDTNNLRPMRGMNLANWLTANGHEVTFWTSNFDHFSKSHRFNGNHEVVVSKHLAIKFVKSRGYQNNIGAARLLDHAQLAFNLKKMLNDASPPDVAFIGYPPIEAAFVMGSWLKNKNVPFILDVKDAWPDILLRAFPTKFYWLGRILLQPYFHMAKQTFRNANGISAPTGEFLDWCMNRCKRTHRSFDLVAPLTSPDKVFLRKDLEEAEEYLDNLGISSDSNLKFTFIGTLNSAFDFKPIIHAAKNSSAEFIIAGDGTQFEKLKFETKEITNIKMLGWISTTIAKVLSSRSSMMLAPFNDYSDFNMSLTNKFYDAMVNGKGMLTSISGSAGKFIEDNKIGLRYSNSEIGSLTELIKDLSIESIIEYGLNARSIYDSEFSYSKIYGNLSDKLVELTKL
jgi:glycosyltransferase involved in cell wall biosynthesis